MPDANQSPPRAFAQSSFPWNIATPMRSTSCFDTMSSELRRISNKLNEREEELTTFSRRMETQEKMIENQEKAALGTCECEDNAHRCCEMELRAQMTQVKALKRQIEDMSTNHATELSKKRRQMDVIQADLRCLRSQIKHLEHNQKTEQRQLARIGALETDNHLLTSTLNAARAFCFDVITLEQSATCVPLTSGQMTSLEGIVGLWAQHDSFTGDVWFPFQCPLTKTITTPIKDLGWHPS